MARCGDVYENKVTGERGVVPRGTEDNDGQPARVHLIVQPRGAVAGEHIHPRIREGFRVISGRPGTRVDEVERTLTAGEEAVAVPGTWHDFWNPGEVDAHVLLELAPLDPRFEQMIGTMYGAGECGQDQRKGDAQSAAAGDAARASRPGARLSRDLSRVRPPPRPHHPRIQMCSRSPGWHHRTRMI